jgi:hypothetical protein
MTSSLFPLWLGPIQAYLPGEVSLHSPSCEGGAAVFAAAASTFSSFSFFFFFFFFFFSLFFLFFFFFFFLS